MRILIIARGYPTPKYPLNGIFEFDQAKALADLGHEVIFAALDMRSLRRWRHWGAESFIQDKVHIEGLSLPGGNIPKPLLHKLRTAALSELYARILKRYGKPDLIHSHFIELGYATTQVLLREQIPLVHTEHYSGMNQAVISDYYQRLGASTYPKLSKIIVVSHALKDKLHTTFNIDPVVIPNIIDLRQFSANIQAKSESTFNYLSVGGLTPNKNMDVLIQAFHQAFSADRSVSLRIIGEGTQHSALETLIKQLHLANQVHLLGLKDRQAIAEIMQESHAFVLASKSETFGLAYLEAMAMGLPVLASRCGGPEDFVSAENGLLVAVDSMEELAQGLRTLKDNITRYDRHRIAQNVKTRYSPDAIATQLSELYRSLVE